MSVGKEIDIQTGSSPKVPRRSCFAMIPMFNWKRGENNFTEKHVIRILQNSNIFESNPLLKTLVIQNIRICCIVIETSGKQSVKILCASVPYLLTLISKTNPKLKKLLKNEQISQCFSNLQCDLELLLSNGYETTVIIYRGLKKYYPTFYVSLIKDSFLASERSLLYLFDTLLYILRYSAEFCMDNIGSVINYLYHHHSQLAAGIVDYFHLFITSAVKALVVGSIYSQKAVIVIFKFIRHAAQFLGHIAEHVCKDPALSNFMKKLCLYLKFYLPYLRSTETCKQFKRNLSCLLYASKPFLQKYFSKTLTSIIHLINVYLPLLKDCIVYAFKKFIPLLRTLIDDNRIIMLKVYNLVRSFIFRNRHLLKSLCCHICRSLYASAIYLYLTFQTILPHIIHISSNAAISLKTALSSFVNYSLHFLKLVYSHIISLWENRKELFCRLSRNFINFFKGVYKLILETQPHMVIIFKTIIRELTTLIHFLASSFLVCFQEINSALFCASREVVSKSCVAVKHVLPSFYLSARIVVPPTIQAAHAVIKSSSNSILIVYPAVFRSIVHIRPELEEGIVVLFTDGKKAGLAVIAVSFSASSELKIVAKTVSTQIPIFIRAVREILSTTSYAAVEVSVTSFNAKKRMMKDLKRAQDTMHTSFLLAEKEIAAICFNTFTGINAVVSNSSKNGMLRDSGKLIKKYVLNSVSELGSKSLKKAESITKFSVSMSYNIAGKTVICFRNLTRILIRIYSYLFFFACSLSSNKLMRKFTLNVATLFYELFITAKDIIANQLKHIYENISYSLCGTDTKIKLALCRTVTKVWLSFKSCIWKSWNAICFFVPQVWAIIVRLTSKIWAFSEKNIPGLWIAWKKCCARAWLLTNEISPYIWLYFYTVTPIVWSTMRTLVQKSWSSCIESTVVTWHHFIYLSSTNWMLSNTYLPYVWFACCMETRRGWKISCYLIETCWTCTVESFLLSWKFLHHSVAKSWSRGRSVTKTAYLVFSTSNSVLHKSICLYIKTKERVYVLSSATFRIKCLSGYSFDFSKIRETLPYFSKETYQCDFDDGDIPHSSHLQLSSNISCYISKVLNFIPFADKLLNCKTFIFPKKNS